MNIYTKTGDDGTTGLYFGGRVRKDSARPAAYGDVDELQAVLGVVRAAAGNDSHENARLLEIIVRVKGELWVLMAELATGEDNAEKLVDGASKVTIEMVDQLENDIDSTGELFELPNEFVVPGETIVGAHLDVARCVARRAERSAISVYVEESKSPEVLVVAYLNRLSDLIWMLARWVDGTQLLAKDL